MAERERERELGKSKHGAEDGTAAEIIVIVAHCSVATSTAAAQKVRKKKQRRKDRSAIRSAAVVAVLRRCSLMPATAFVRVCVCVSECECVCVFAEQHLSGRGLMNLATADAVIFFATATPLLNGSTCMHTRHGRRGRE